MLERLGPYEFVVEAWWDRFGGFRRDFAKKLDAGVAQPVDHADGRALVRRGGGEERQTPTAWRASSSSLMRPRRPATLRLSARTRTWRG